MLSRDIYNDILDDLAQYIEMYADKEFNTEDFIPLYKTRYSNNITIEDWNTLFHYISNLNSDGNLNSEAIKNIYSRMTDILEYVDELSKSNVSIKKLEGPFSNYHDFAKACIDIVNLNKNNQMFISSVSIKNNSHTVIGLASKTQADTHILVISSDGIIIVSNGEQEYSLRGLTIEESILYNVRLLGDNFSRGRLYVNDPNGDTEATPKKYVDIKSEEAIPYISVEAPPTTLNKKVWLQVENEEPVTETSEPLVENKSEDVEDLSIDLVDYEDNTLDASQEIFNDNIIFNDSENDSESNNVLLDETFNENVIFNESESGDILIDETSDNILYDSLDDNIIYLE